MSQQGAYSVIIRNTEAIMQVTEANNPYVTIGPTCIDNENIGVWKPSMNENKPTIASCTKNDPTDAGIMILSKNGMMI